MYPLWIAVIFSALLASYSAISIPMEEKARNEAIADTSAVNFLAYRRSVQKYLEANPSATGTISDASLATYWVPGYVRDANWSNQVSGGTLFVYSTAAVQRSTLDSIYSRSGKSLLVGKKGASGNLISSRGIDTGVVLPGAIAVGSVVLMGK